MTNWNVYSVFDCKAGSYSQPFCFLNDAMARRSFSVSVNEVGSQMFHAPEDFVLYRVGVWDCVNGKLTGGELDAVCTALQVKEVK